MTISPSLHPMTRSPRSSRVSHRAVRRYLTPAQRAHLVQEGRISPSRYPMSGGKRKSSKRSSRRKSHRRRRSSLKRK